MYSCYLLVLDLVHMHMLDPEIVLVLCAHVCAWHVHMHVHLAFIT